MGLEAYSFIDRLVDAGQTYWQILPLGPTGYGDSPYQCFSAFAGNTLLISPEKLVELEILKESDISQFPDLPSDRVNFGAVYEWKTALLAKAFERFHDSTDAGLHKKFGAFLHENAWWLDDFAAYRAIKKDREHKPWYEWPDALKFRDPSAINAEVNKLRSPVQAEKFYQFLFFEQWMALKKHAENVGIKIIGDIPIFVALDSVDVWCNQSKFKLNTDGSPKVVAGVPPDYFSTTGQLWGNPIYDWEAMKADDFHWWAARVAFALKTVDIVRIDHFRGFAAVWEVPGGDKTAENGAWVDVPGKELFSAIKRSLKHLPVIAEDLGVITPDVVGLRDAFGFPGMRILQYAFGGDAANQDLPHNYVRNCVAYTGTHDNDTVVGWWNSQTGSGSTRAAEDISREQEFCLRYLNTDGSEMHWDFIRAVWSSVADTVIVPMQDVLGLGSESRMNLPASNAGNWSWRMEKDALTGEIAAKLLELTDIYGRNRRD